MSDINGREISKDKELIFPNISTHEQRKDHYIKEVMKHPAIVWGLT